jgi:DNA-binding XRE family transcriptional regulator
VTAPRFKHLGEVVRYLRHAAGLTKTELDYAAGLSPGTLRRIEDGRYFPPWTTFDKLCAHFSMKSLVEVCVREGVQLGIRPPAKA